MSKSQAGNGWTEMEFIAALRAAGWKRVRGPARIYRSPDYVEFHLDECHAETGVRWRWYAARRELPTGLQEWQVRLRERMREGITVSSSQSLHPTAERMYRYIIRYKRMSGGDSPTRRELAAGVGLPSVSMVQHHLDALERAGRIERPKRGKARMLVIPGAYWQFDEAAAGQNKCAMRGEGEGAGLPEEGRKVREGLGENHG